MLPLSLPDLRTHRGGHGILDTLRDLLDDGRLNDSIHTADLPDSCIG